MSLDSVRNIPRDFNPPSSRGEGDYNLMPSPIDALPLRVSVFTPHELSPGDSPLQIIPNRVTIEFDHEDSFPLTSRALLTPRGTSRVDLGEPPSPESAETPDLDLPCCRGNWFSSFKESVVKKVKVFAAKWCCCGSESSKAQSPKKQELSTFAVSNSKQRKESRFLYRNDEARYLTHEDDYHVEESSAQPNAKVPSFTIKYTIPLALQGAPSADAD